MNLKKVFGRGGNKNGSCQVKNGNDYCSREAEKRDQYFSNLKIDLFYKSPKKA